MMEERNTRALISGVNGQCGITLSEFLLERGYEVYGIVRRSSVNNLHKLDHIINDINIIDGDLTDQQSINNAVKISKPDKIFNLAAQSFVPFSFSAPEQTCNVTGLGVLRMLEAMKEFAPNSKFIQMSSSEMFGNTYTSKPLDENSTLYARSPYSAAKIFGYHICRNYRESYNLHISNAICFNYEGIYRDSKFVTKKITQGVARIYTRKQDKLYMGNTKSCRDWSSVKDIVNGIYLMTEQDTPDDYVFCSGETHSIEEFLEIAFNYVNLNYKDYVEIDPKFYRPAEVNTLLGDYSKAKEKLEWTPKISFQELIEEMVENDLKIEKNT